MTGPLNSLHGFYEPVPPAWVPQTIGWYCVFAAAAIAAAWFAVGAFRSGCTTVIAARLCTNCRRYR